MRVLLSAYACEPDRGSEPEVGWQRAIHMLAHADEVWVLTRANNRDVIEADPLSCDPKLHFIYYDLPAWALTLKKRFWFLSFYFILWQWEAYQAAALRHREIPFDRVYHVTFASMRSGSFLGRLGVPFVIGPIAGGERSPLRLRRGMPLRGQLSELARDLGILWQRCNPIARAAFAAAEKIYITTEESLRLIPRRWRCKTAVQLAIATLGSAQIDARPLPEAPRFLFAGRLIHWKGAHFAIQALAEVRRSLPAATLTLIGAGPDEQWLMKLAMRLGVADAVEFAGRFSRKSLIGRLRSYTALVYPSLHDSGGLVVLEALSNGLPAICLDLGGPGVLVKASCGIVVPTADANEAELVTRIAKAMILLGSMPADESMRLSRGAIDRANELSWARLTARIAALQ